MDIGRSAGTPAAGPFETEAEARAAAIALGGPPDPGRPVLSPEQRFRMLAKACEEAGVTLGTYDARFLAWLSRCGDGFSGVFTGIVTRRQAERAEAVELLERVLFLRQNGERAPGGNETWPPLDRDVEAFLREDMRRRTLGRLWVARCELSPEVMQAMDGEALADHLRDAHPDDGE